MKPFKRLLALTLAATLVGASAPAFATTQQVTGRVPNREGTLTDPAITAPMNPDGSPAEAPYFGAVPLVADTAQAVQRSVGANCSVAGNVQLTLSDGSSITVSVQTGLQILPFAATTVVSAGTTATCSLWNLK